MVISFVTSAKMVGLTKYPSVQPLGNPRPPAARKLLHQYQPELNVELFQIEPLLEIGPILVSASNGSPTFIAFAVADAISTLS